MHNLCKKHGQTNCIACYSPSPEARCEHNWGSWAGEKFEHNKCCLCGAYKVPYEKSDPEARVDWNEEDELYLTTMLPFASGCFSGQVCEWPQLKPILAWAYKKILGIKKAAFEKGREAR